MINFSEPKQSGNFKKVTITKSNGRKLMIETESCFSWGIQKSDRYESYSLPLVLNNDSETLKELKGIIQQYQGHLPENEFSKCLYEKPDTTTIYPKLKCFSGKFSFRGRGFRTQTITEKAYY